PRMVDEAGFQGPDDLDELLDRQVVLGMLRVEGPERLLDQLAGEFGERLGARARRVDEDVPSVEAAPPFLIAEVGIEVEGGHDRPRLEKTRCFRDLQREELRSSQYMEGLAVDQLSRRRCARSSN